MAIFVLSSCSRVQLIYEYGDWFLERSLNRSLSLERQKRQDLRQRVKAYFAAHRIHELPHWSYFLHSTADLIEKSSPTEMKIKESVDDLERLLKRSLALGSRSFSEVMLSLDSLEINKMELNLKKENQQRLEELQKESEKKYRTKRYDRIEGWIEFFVGKTSKDQKQLIREFVDDFDYKNRSLWVRNRDHQQARFLSFLRSRPGLAEMETYLNEQINQPESSRLPEYQKQIDDGKKRFYLFAQRLSESLTSNQKKQFVSRLKSLGRDFTQLATKD
jgi:hypothetical protein